ncbi:cell envelope integrity protein CreD [Faucicola boevrei]|uniref:cell envelope integrity protein CreD n=1 Tax=Faucicola boevrei TaxID=346665 RepID=UPI000375AA39|nr:cell envelope integrity protein CreD [Moraxella boevrei]
MQKTLFSKLMTIALLCGLFAIALAFVSGIIDERQQYYHQVMDDIKATHVSDQYVMTPFIAVANSQGVHIPNFATQSDIKSQANVSDKDYHRSIYHAISYNNKLSINQQFNLGKYLQLAPLIEKTEQGYQLITGGSVESTIEAKNNVEVTTVSATPANSQAAPQTNPQNLAKETPKQPAKPTPRFYDWQTAKLIIPISDLRGVTLPKVTINGKKYTAEFPKVQEIPEIKYVEVSLAEMFNNEIQRSQWASKADLAVNIELELVGIDSFHVMPLGDNFGLNLQSNWQDPKFFGKALPTKNFSPTGFVAKWQNQFLATENNKTVSECLYVNATNCYFLNGNDGNWLSTAFVESNDTYTQTDRTLKYALLLIVVSFGTFFLFEVLKDLRIHPIQYGLVATGLLVFYVLLLSFAEHIAFWQAYSIASLACVGLIGCYTFFVLKSWLRSAIFSAILGGLYAGFYLILASEGMNLLLGAVFCFVLLAIVMFLTRNIDWYQIGETREKTPETLAMMTNNNPE